MLIVIIYDTGTVVLKSRPLHPLPDMSPFFVRPFAKGQGQDVFSTFPHLLTEMVLRLPYQVNWHILYCRVVMVYNCH